MSIKWLSKEKCFRLLKKEKYGRLATSDLNGQPYIVPLNFVLLENKIYFHGGFKGRKLENLRSNARVCFEVSRIGKLQAAPQAKNFSYRFWSVLVEGSAREIKNAELKLAVLNALMKKYAADYHFTPLSLSDMVDVHVVEMAVEKLSGKVSLAATSS